jgi:Rrf2 family protein
MLKINKNVEYALMSLVILGTENQLNSAKNLAKKLKISIMLLRKILHQLASQDLILSVQGQKGGYRLKRRPDEITLKNVIEALEGRQRLVPCLDGQVDCNRSITCNIKLELTRINDKWQKLLETSTLRDFLRFPMESKKNNLENFSVYGIAPVEIVRKKQKNRPLELNFGWTNNTLKNTENQY